MTSHIFSMNNFTTDDDVGDDGDDAGADDDDDGVDGEAEENDG